MLAFTGKVLAICDMAAKGVDFLEEHISQVIGEIQKELLSVKECEQSGETPLPVVDSRTVSGSRYNSSIQAAK